MMAELKLLIILMLSGAVAPANLAKGPNLRPTLTERGSSKSCITRTGQPGLCVLESYCNEEHTILPGGVIDTSELRSSGCPTDTWCCSDELLATAPPVTKSSQGCFAQKEDYCPWCVSLFRASDKKIKDSGLFCAGVLLGSNVVLTTATCDVVSQTQTVWARIPDSAEPERNYTVRYRKSHASYNSGTRENDLALFVLESEVTWNGAGKGACLSLRDPLKDACYAFGYDSNDQFVSTLLAVTEGSCMRGGSTADVSCGRPIDGEPCIVATGAPVICQGNSKDLIVAGIARTPCRNSSVQLGAISPASRWFHTELAKVGLSESRYTYSN